MQDEATSMSETTGPVLGLEIAAVSNHVSNIFAELHLSDRAAAIVRAREAGLGHS